MRFDRTPIGPILYVLGVAAFVAAFVIFPPWHGGDAVHRLCTGGAAFAAAAYDEDSLTRMPEWDNQCPKDKVGTVFLPGTPKHSLWDDWHRN